MTNRPLGLIGSWLATALTCGGLAHAENWPAWRGPRGDGASQETGVPVRWSESSNVVWRAALPGIGHASPIVWEDHLFTVTALPDTEERVLLAVDIRTGAIRWQRSVVKAPLEGKHRLNSHASSTPATDGRLIYTAFLDGTRMLVSAHDFTGRLQWSVRPGQFHSVHGFCSSPVLHEERVIINGDHDGDSYLVALARDTGRTLWKVARPNKTRSYCVPTIFELGGRVQMVLSGDKSVASYDPRDGPGTGIWMGRPNSSLRAWCTIHMRICSSSREATRRCTSWACAMTDEARSGRRPSRGAPPRGFRTCPHPSPRANTF